MTAIEHPTDDRYRRGVEILKTVGGLAGSTLESDLADIAPDLARLTIEFGYGDVYSRPGLTLRQRQVINVAALTALGTAAPQLRFHIDGALNVGVSAAEVVEIIIHMSVYAGIPAALNGIAAAKIAFADRVDLTDPVVIVDGPGDETARRRFERGVEMLGRVDGEAGEAVVAFTQGIAPDLGRYIIEYAFADIYSRPVLDLKTRELATVAACTALGTAAPQLRVHLHGLLNTGGTRTEAIEAIIQMAVYAGIPAALNGIGAAREVFAARSAAAAEE